jgi:hypothetical protein
LPAGSVQHVDPMGEMRPGFHSAGDFRPVELGIHEQGEHQALANVPHVGFRENELAGPLPVLAQLPLLAHSGHVIARLTNRVQRTAILGWQRAA